MLIDEILISALPGDRRAAARYRGSLVRLISDGGGDQVRQGDIRLGRIIALAPAIDGAFVDVGAGRSGLLMRADATPGQPLAEGAMVVVRVARAPDGGKGAKLDGRLSIEEATAPQPGAPGLVRAAEDPVAVLLRDAAGPGLRGVVVDDAATLTALRGAVPEVAPALVHWREATPLFAAEGVDEAIEAALAPQVPLRRGGRLLIEETAALVAIDVDSGAAAGASARAAALSVNIEAAEEIARQILLRELAGLIVIDFVPLRRPVERERVLQALRGALGQDGRKMRIAGWTRLGLLEIVRERRGPSLRQSLSVSCASCNGTGVVFQPDWAAGQALRQALAQCRSHPLMKPELEVSPAVARALAGPLAAAVRDVEVRLGCRINIKENALLPADGFRLPAAEVAG